MDQSEAPATISEDPAVKEYLTTAATECACRKALKRVRKNLAAKSLTIVNGYRIVNGILQSIDAALAAPCPCTESRPAPDSSRGQAVTIPDGAPLDGEDGEQAFAEMLEFWDGRLPFKGVVIHWKYSKAGV